MKPGNYAAWIVTAGATVFEESNLWSHRGTLTPSEVPPESEWQCPVAPDLPGSSIDHRSMSEAQDVVRGSALKDGLLQHLGAVHFFQFFFMSYYAISCRLQAISRQWGVRGTGRNVE